MSASVTPRAGLRFNAALLMLTGSFGCALGLGAAHAATVDGAAPSRTVRYSADSLATDDGVQRLYRRILGAARQVCPDESGNLAVSARVAACREQAVAHAIQQIDNTRLAALHASRTKSG